MAYRGCKYYHHGCELGGPCDGACAYYQDSDDDYIPSIQHQSLSSNSTDASNQDNAPSKKIVKDLVSSYLGSESKYQAKLLLLFKGIRALSYK